MTARPLQFQRDVHGAGFALPQGVIDAERLSPQPGDGSLIQQLRRDLTAKDQRIDDLEASERASANLIADLQAEHALTLSCTFAESESISVLSKAVAALVNVGHDVVMKFELVDDRRSLNVYVKDAA